MANELLQNLRLPRFDPKVRFHAPEKRFNHPLGPNQLVFPLPCGLPRWLIRDGSPEPVLNRPQAFYDGVKRMKRRAREGHRSLPTTTAYTSRTTIAARCDAE